MHSLDLDAAANSLPAWVEPLRQYTTRKLVWSDKAVDTPSIDKLRALLESQPETAACLAEAQRKPGESQILYLRSSDPAWLNLPWRKAVTEPNVQIVATPVLEALPQYAPAIAPPFRILVMISAPVDQEAHRKLDYETEEYRIIQALSPLIEQGQVYIDFTDDGSLEALERKLAEQPYHALHFSGHGIYQKGIGMLELENPNTLTKQLVSADAFVQALTATPAHTPPLVVLAACQTAQGRKATDQAGLAHTLVRAGVPAIVAMNESIFDKYAILFASRLYQYIAQGETLPYAFKIATEAIRGAEVKENNESKNEKNKPEPFQWLIPELLVAKEVLRLVDTQRRPEELVPESHVFEFTDSGVELVLQRGKAFVGRRKERSELLSALAKQQPVLLLGMGGVGKTALAAQLLHGLSLQKPAAKLLVFNELTFKTSTVFERLLALLPELHRQHNIKPKLEGARDTAEQMGILLDALRDARIEVAFVFDNLESFQSGPGQPFQEAYADQEAIIQTVARYKASVFVSESAAPNAVEKKWTFPLILTARYPLADMEGGGVRDIHQSSLNDFWKRALHTQLYQTYLRFREAQEADIQQKISPNTEPVAYLDFIQQLHTRLGGNFRLLEYFDDIMAERPEALRRGWANLQALENELQAAREGMDSGPRSLALGGLLALLTADERLALQLLAHFRIPVHETALRMQQDQDHLPALGTLARMTLIEQQETQPGWISWYAVPLVKDYLEANPVAEVGFSHEMAGRYYRHAADNLARQRLEQQEEAFDHFCLAGNKEQVVELEDTLSAVYHGASLYQPALLYAQMAEQVAGTDISTNLRNRIGILFIHFGDYDQALIYYKTNLPRYREVGDKSGEGTTLNNLSQVYAARGDYNSALEYLEQSLRIRREIGDKSGEGTILNNISQIFKARGDYETALLYLEQSLRIMREIGDRSGEGTALNNINGIYRARSDYDRALGYLEQSLRIAREIGDKSGEGTTLNNLSQIYTAQGDYDRALGYLEQSLRIVREIGDKSGEGATLNNLSQIFKSHGDYGRALGYLEQSLRIVREIGDKSGEGTTLNNLSQIYTARGDYDRALGYLEQSLRIVREIGDKSGEGATLNNLSQIFKFQGDYDRALDYLGQSLRIAREIGDKSREGAILNNLATTAHAREDYKAALQYLEQSLRIRREIGDKAGEGATLNNLSQICSACRDYEAALQYLEQSLHIMREIRNKAGEGATLNNLSQIFKASGDYETALQYLEQSLRIQREIGDINGQAITLNNMAVNLLRHQSKPEEALSLFWESYQFFKQIGSPNERVPAEYLDQINAQLGPARFQKILQSLQTGDT